MRETFQEIFLKALFLLLGIMMVLPAHADLTEKHQELCQSSDVKKFKGSNGTCRIVISPKPEVMKGVCSGVFVNTPCTATFDSEDKSIHLSCGETDDDTTIDFSLEGEFIKYKVAAIVTKPDTRILKIFGSTEKTLVKNDPVLYKQIYNSALTINLNEVLVNGKVVVKPTMMWTNEAGSIELKNVVCR
jgi:hypothetical protein